MSLVRSLTRFTRNEVLVAFKNARPAKRGRAFALFVAPAGKNIGRILIMTPRKVGSAPQRNLLKRRVKSLFYEEKLYLCPYDALITLKKDALALSFSELRTLFLDAFSRTLTRLPA